MKDDLQCPGYERKAHKCKPSDFYEDKERRAGGHSYYCKECHRKRNRQYWKNKYYPEHREDLIKVNGARQKNSP